MVELKLEELARIMGKTRMQVEEMLRNNDVIELNLSERKQVLREEKDDLKIFE